MRIALVGAELEENLAIRYIRGALEADGHQVTQVAFNRADDTDEAARLLASSGAELAGFSMVFTYRATEFAALARRARELGFCGHLVAGGHFAAFNAGELLHDERAFDSVVLGEGERIACELARNLGDLGAVCGLVWRATDGSIVRNAPAGKPADLDELPLPVRKQPFGEYLGLPIVNMLSSRGCTHACAFCSIAAWHRLCGGARFRLRRPECVAEEMADLYAQGVRIFNFHDDNFFLGDAARTRERVERMAEVWRRRGMGRIAFAVKSRPDSVDADLFAYLKSLGLFRVFLGIEAGTADALKKLGRGQTLEQNERALETVNRLDLHACFNLLMLNPDSTLEDFRANLAFLRAHPRNPMNFCRTEVYSGTPLEDRLRRAGRLRGTYWGYGYRIADPRAQAVFEILYACLPYRHFGEPNVQHMTMNVDYELQLRNHFFGVDHEWRRRVKAYLVRVNLDTCDRLERVAAWVATHSLDGAERRAFEEQLSRETAASNEWLLAEGRRLLDGIRRSVEPEGERTGTWGRRFAAAGLAAALAFSAATLTSAEEMAPEPPREEGRAEDIRDQVRKDILPHIAARLERPTRLQIQLEVDADGSLKTCSAVIGDGEMAVPALIPDVIFEKKEARGKPFSLLFDEETVREAMETPPVRVPTSLAESKALTIQNRSELLRILCGSVTPAQDVFLEIWVSPKGRVENVLLFPKGAPASVRALTEAEEKEAQKAIRDLAADEFDVREKAEKTLRELSRSVVPLLRKTMAATNDPEVKRRCEYLVRLNGGAMPGADAAALFLSAGDQRVEREAWGRRVLVSFSQRELELARRRMERETHMHEMAPAPRD